MTFGKRWGDVVTTPRDQDDMMNRAQIYVLYFRDDKDNSPLHLAAANGYTKSMRLLHQVYPNLLDLINKDGVSAWNSETGLVWSGHLYKYMEDSILGHSKAVLPSKSQCYTNRLCLLNRELN